MAQLSFPCTSCGALIEVEDNHSSASVGCSACGLSHDSQTGAAVTYASRMPLAWASPHPSDNPPAVPFPDQSQFPQIRLHARSSRKRKVGLLIALVVAGGAALVVAVVAIIALFALRPATTDGWYEHVSEEGRYSVKFPVQPVLNARVRKTPHGERMVHRATCVQDGVAYEVVYLDVDVRAEWGYQIDRKESFGLLSERTGATLQSWDSVSLDDHDAYRGIFVNDLGYRFEFLIALIGNRVFVIGCESPDPDAEMHLKLFVDSFKYAPAGGTVTRNGHLIRDDDLTRETAVEHWKALYVPGRRWSHYVRTGGSKSRVEGVEVVSVESLSAWIRPFRYVDGEIVYDDVPQRQVRFESDWSAYLAQRDLDPPTRMIATRSSGRNLIEYVWGEVGSDDRIQYAGEYVPFLVVEARARHERRELFTFDEPYNPVRYGGEGRDQSRDAPTAPLYLSGPLVDVYGMVGDRIEVWFDVSDGLSPYVWTVRELPAGLSWNAEGSKLLVSGTPERPGGWSLEVAVTDQGKRKASRSTRVVVREPPPPAPENAGPMTFIGGKGRAFVGYAALIDVAPPVGKEHLQIKYDKALLPPGLEVGWRDATTIEICGCPKTKGEYRFDVALEATLPQHDYKKVSSSVTVVIVIEAGPHEAIKPLMGETTLIAFQGGEYGLVEADIVKLAFNALTDSLTRADWFGVSFYAYHEWESWRQHPSFSVGSSDDSRSASYRIRDWSHFNKKPLNKSSKAWEELPAHSSSWVGPGRMGDALVIVSPLRECDSEDELAVVKISLMTLAAQEGPEGGVKRLKKIGIVTTRTDVPQSFKSWLETQGIKLVVLQP